MFNMKKVTAGKDALGEFAPLFARLNDDVLFGEVWSREEALSPKIRSILTVAALTVEGVFDSSFTQAGPRRGRLSDWRKISGRKRRAAQRRLRQGVFFR